MATPTSFDTFEGRLKKAVTDGLLPCAVLLAKDKTGKLNYELSVGPTTLKDPKSPTITPRTLFTMASMSKLLTSVAVLLLVEARILDLDDEVAQYLPVLAEQPVITGFDSNGKPQFTPRTQPIRVRHLLTHSAGTGYILMDESLTAWANATGRPLPVPLRTADLSGGAKVDSRFGYPLLFQPGEGWIYGSATDWAGKLVEELTGGFLDDYMHENIFAKVGVPRGGITFHPGRFEDPIQPIAGMSHRDPETGKVEFYPTEFSEVSEAFGGEGMFGGMGEYIKVLESLMLNDGRILKPKTAELLFTPLLEGKAKAALNESMAHPDWVVGVVPPGIEYNWTAGGLIFEKGSHEHRKKWFLQWGGAWNMSWFIDREAGVCAVFGTQIFPPADPVAASYMKEFEDVIYATLKDKAA